MEFMRHRLSSNLLIVLQRAYVKADVTGSNRDGPPYEISTSIFQNSE